MIFEDLSIFETATDEQLRALCKKRETVKKELNLYRSSLMVRADNPKHLNKLDALNADIAVINLEDGIAPSQKERALYLASAFIGALKESNSYISIRINPLSDGGENEIRFLNEISPDCIRIPKIRTPKDVEHALSLVDENIDIALSIETKEAFSSLGALALDSRVKLFYLGILDLLNSLGLPQNLLSYENPTIEYILSRFLVETKTASAIPISFVYQNFKDIDGFKEWCEMEKEMGYAGKGCIAPVQADIANELFGVGSEALKKALEIKELFEASAKEGITGFVSNKYGFIDEPIYKDALLVLSKYKTS